MSLRFRRCGFLWPRLGIKDLSVYMEDLDPAALDENKVAEGNFSYPEIHVYKINCSLMLSKPIFLQDLQWGAAPAQAAAAKGCQTGFPSRSLQRQLMQDTGNSTNGDISFWQNCSTITLKLRFRLTASVPWRISGQFSVLLFKNQVRNPMQEQLTRPMFFL